MSRTFANAAQTIKIGMLLDQHLKRENGNVFYEEGWDDGRIADEVSLPDRQLNAGHVGSIRRQLYGNFKRPGATDAITDEVAALTEALRTVTEKYNALAYKLNTLALLHEKLCLKLSLEHVADVRYLAGTNANAAEQLPLGVTQ